MTWKVGVRAEVGTPINQLCWLLAVSLVCIVKGQNRSVTRSVYWLLSVLYVLMHAGILIGLLRR